MIAREIMRYRRAAESGVRTTTRRNRILPAPPPTPPIPGRLGVSAQTLKKRTLADLMRGFVLRPHAGAAGTRFDPYTLAVLNAGYTLAGAGYEVQPFATGYNVFDATHWRDVVCLYANTIRVNAITMRLLDIPAAATPWKAIPHLIPDSDAGAPYGTEALNATQKRVFAVGRYAVKSFAAGGVVSTLAPSTPRTDHKAMTLGPRVDSATHKAHLGQIYYTGAFFDSAIGGWAFSAAEVSMLLTPGYLSSVASSASVDMPVASLSSGGTSSGSETTGLTLPDTVVGYKGYGVLRWVNAFPPPDTFAQVRVQYPTADRHLASVPGQLVRNYSRLTYAGAASQTETMAGVSVSYAGSNTKTWDDGTRQKKHAAVNIDLPGGGSGVTTNRLNIGGGATTLVWTRPSIPGVLGPPSANLPATTFGAYAFDEDAQDGSFTVTAGGATVCSVVFSVRKTAGDVSTLNPNLTIYDADIAAGTVDAFYGTGDLQGDGNLYFYKTPPAQTPAVIAEINAEFQRMKDIFMARVLVGNNNVPRTAPAYSQSIAAGAENSYTASLIWQTVDYLLRDDVNGVYVSVEGSFSGAQSGASAGSATLTVSVRVKTRHHDNLITLYTGTFSYLQLLPESTVTSGKTAVPSPKVRAFHAPLHHHQGSFKGAAYVTLAEETAGSTPAHLFNFALSLRPYSDLGTIDEANDTGAPVAFVAPNLLECLYAFVFSQKYGLDPVLRYPVEAMDRYSAVTAGLFSAPFAIRVRDGVVAEWAAPFGSTYLASTGAGIFRT